MRHLGARRVWRYNGGEHVNQSAAALENLAQQCGHFRVARQPHGLHAGPGFILRELNQPRLDGLAKRHVNAHPA